MTNKVITINNQTDFKTIMLHANCETRLNRKGSELQYFKFKSSCNGKWVKLITGDRLRIDSEYNLTQMYTIY
jgi:hypothetical protein